MLPGELLLEGGDLAGTSGVLRGVVLLRVGGVCAGWARLLSEAFFNLFFCLEQVRRRRHGLNKPTSKISSFVAGLVGETNGRLCQHPTGMLLGLANTSTALLAQDKRCALHGSRLGLRVELVVVDPLVPSAAHDQPAADGHERRCDCEDHYLQTRARVKQCSLAHQMAR